MDKKNEGDHRESSKGNNGAPDQGPISQSPRIEDRKATADTEQEFKKEKKSPWRRFQEWRKNPFRDRAGWTDKAIVFLTAGIVFLAWMQWNEMHDSGKQTDRIIDADNRMVTALENSNITAQSAFAANITQTEIAQRAWVYAVALADGPVQAGKAIDIRVQVKNSGRTPAIDVRTVTGRTVVEASEVPDLSLSPPAYKRSQFVTDGNINPDSMNFSDFVLPVTVEDVDRINTMKVRVYVHGRIEYRDVFGAPHWNTFCFFFLPGGAFAIYSKYNEMDHNQPQQQQMPALK
ncbi:MAG: hypothetical protein WB524_15125 [Acidobacteriaceae bacterium]